MSAPRECIPKHLIHVPQSSVCNTFPCLFSAYFQLYTLLIHASVECILCWCPTYFWLIQSSLMQKTVLFFSIPSFHHKSNSWEESTLSSNLWAQLESLFCTLQSIDLLPLSHSIPKLSKECLELFNAPCLCSSCLIYLDFVSFFFIVVISAPSLRSRSLIIFMMISLPSLCSDRISAYSTELTTFLMDNVTSNCLCTSWRGSHTWFVFLLHKLIIIPS